jgi:hypothetical protein
MIERIHIAIAESAEDLRDVFRLRHRVLVEEEGYYPESTEGLIHTVFDAYPSSVNLLARVGEEAAASVRVTFDSGVGLPWDRLGDLACLRDSVEEPAVALGMLVCTRRYRAKRSMLIALLRAAAHLIHERSCVHMFAAVNPEFAPSLERMGFNQVGSTTRIGGFDNDVVPMHGRIDRLRPPFDRHFAPRPAVRVLKDAA